MAAEAEVQRSATDVVKLLAAALIIAAGIAGFYWFEEYPLVLRVLGFLVFTALGIFVGLQSERGRAIRQFFLDARIEVRKVVWPSRQETIQTTLIVFAVVLAMGVFLWLVDMGLLAIVRRVTGHGG
jgi:preprotein translocase subunit SecE